VFIVCPYSETILNQPQPRASPTRGRLSANRSAKSRLAFVLQLIAGNLPARPDEEEIMITMKEAFWLPALVLVLAVAGECVQRAPAATAPEVLEAKQSQISVTLSPVQDAVMAGSPVNVRIVAPDVIPAAVYLASRDVYLPAMEAAQALEHQAEESPLCDPDQIDGTFTFASLPPGKQTISLHFRNKGNVACRLQGQAGASFSVDGHSMTIARCWLCELNYTPSLLTERQPGNQILLAPGERATLDMQWASTGEPCQWADGVDFTIHWLKPTAYLFVPSNWPMHICSAVKSAGYRADAHSPSMGAVRDGLLRVSVTPTVIYRDEQATLHVELAAQTAVMESSAGCASLYTVRHGPSMPTRFEPLATMGFSSRPSFTPKQILEDKERGPSFKANHQRRCDIAGGRATADATISAADLATVTHIEWRAAPGPGEEPVFLTAATHFSVLDVDTLEPNWGDPAKGIRVGLSIDRERFKVGERVPLHLWWENVNAAMPLAEGECKEPEPDLEIQDSQHNVVRTVPDMTICAGHGWGPFTIPKGKVQRTFIQLATAHSPQNSPLNDFRGDLPGPGVYYLVSVWSPLVLEPDAEPDKTRIGSGHAGKVYATVRSLPVRIEVESK